MLTLIATGVLAMQAAASPPVLQRLLDCRSIADRDQRLACFDREAGTVVEAQRTRDIVVLDGRRAERGERLAAAAGPDEPVESTIAAASQIGRDRWTLRLADGSRWQQIDGTVSLPPRVGDAVRIRPASLGSYFATIANRRAFRVRFLPPAS